MVMAASAVVGAFIFALVHAAVRTLRPSEAGDDIPRTSGAGSMDAESDQSRRFRQQRRWTVAGIIIVLAALLLAAAGWRQPVSPVDAALVLICGSLTVVAAVFAIDSVAGGEGLRFDSHWGGLGGGMGGWRVSPTTTLVLLSLLFLAATFTAASFDGDERGTNNSTTSEPVVDRSKSAASTVPAIAAPATRAPAPGAPVAASPAPTGNTAAPQ
jgi:uncharacterized membrane protein